MSKIVVLVGSVRKGGNTDLLAQAFCDGAKQNNEVEIISVADYDVKPCIGCNTCFEREGNKCFREDDMRIIYDKLAEADIIAVASPVYFYGISAQLKAIVDRLHTPMRNGFKVKKLALLLTAAATLPTVFDAIKVQYQLILDFFNLENVGMILVKGVKDKGDIKGNVALEEAYALGSSIISEQENEYDEQMKARRNVEYLDMIDKSMAEAEAGKFVIKTIGELEEEK